MGEDNLALSFLGGHMASIETLKIKRKMLESSLYKKIDQINKAQAELNRKRESIYDYYNSQIEEIDSIIASINGRDLENSRP